MTSDQEKNLFLQAQAYQQQIQGLLMQKETLNMQTVELKRALDEIEKSTETDVYKIAGTIIIKAPKAAVKKELTDRKEGIEAMVKALDTNEKKIKAKITDLKDKFSKEDGKAAED